ncbi:MAG: helix-hairpin-helix domain-containing protein [Lachnospiraceae bacterium]|nr:helix-hairpin-helix domain-containing protein [Lachnospiraceae bacterium]
MKETKKSSKKAKMTVVRRVAVIAAFTIAGLCFVSSDEGEDVFVVEKTRVNNIEAVKNESDPSESTLVTKTGADQSENTGFNKTENYMSESTGRETIAHESLTSVDVMININTADEKELMTLKGIGPAKAGKIVGFRTEHGLFIKIEDLMLVPGIKEGTFSDIKDCITVG